MKKCLNFARVLSLVCALLLMSCVSVFVATDWESSVIEVEAQGHLQ